MSTRFVLILVCLGGICSLSTAQNLIVNGGFEEPPEGPATTFSSWERWRGSGKPNVARRVSDQVASGKWALFIELLPHGGSQIVEQRFTNYEPGQMYEIIFQALSAKPYDAFRVSVIDRHASLPYTQTLVTHDYSNLKWTQYTVRFTAPEEAGHPLYLRLQAIGPTPDSAVYFDDAQIIAVSEAAREFTATHAQVENDTFNAMVSVEFDLSTELDVINWLLADLAEYRVAEPDELQPLQQRSLELSERIEASLRQLHSFREERLLSGVILSALPDAKIAEESKRLEVLVNDLGEAIEEARAEIQPVLAALGDAAKQLEGDWEPPAEQPARYSPKMLNDRFHRIISYRSHRMPISDHMRRSLWELKPTIMLGSPHPDYTDPDHTDYLKHTLPRTMPYVASMQWPEWFDPDLAKAKEDIDAIFDERRDAPAFAGIGLDEPSITDKHVCTPEGYAEFREWLLDRYDEEVGGFPLPDALKWHQPEKIQGDLDLVMWTEMQEFKTYWMARQLKALQDYVYSKDPEAVFQVVIQQFLPSTPQRASYVTVPAALDWISMDPYNSASVGEAFLMDLLRSNSRGPNLLVVGTCYDRTPGRFAKDMAISFAHCGGLYNWTYIYMSKYRSPVGVTTGAWPPKYRGRWKEGMYDAALDIMGKMAVIEPYLVHTETAANVGLVYSERTGIYCSLPDTPDYYISNLGIYQALQQLHIPVEALLAEAMTPQRLYAFNCLILVDAEILTDKEADVLKDWCAQGGSLIIMGGTGSRDQWGRPRHDFGPVTELLGVTRGQAKAGASTWSLDGGPETRLDSTWQYETAEPADEATQIIGRFDNGDIAAISHPYGQGHVSWLTARNLGFSFEGSKHFKGMHKAYWAGFRDSLRTLVLQALHDAGARPPVRAQNAPDNVEVGLRKQADRLIVHLLNYDDEGPVRNMVLIADRRAGQRAFYPASGQEVDANARGRNLHIRVRDFEHHCCIVIEPRKE